MYEFYVNVPYRRNRLVKIPNKTIDIHPLAINKFLEINTKGKECQLAHLYGHMPLELLMLDLCDNHPEARWRVSDGRPAFYM